MKGETREQAAVELGTGEKHEVRRRAETRRRRGVVVFQRRRSRRVEGIGAVSGLVGRGHGNEARARHEGEVG